MCKSVLYLNRNYFSYNHDIARQLVMDGYDVFNMEFDPKNINMFQRKYYAKKKINYHKYMFTKYCEDEVLPIARENNIDVIIMAFLTFTREQMLTLKKVCPNAKIIFLMFDDMTWYEERYQEGFDLFDEVVTYSPYDAEKYGFHYNPNFYGFEEQKEKKYDWTFIGTAPEQRKVTLNKILKNNPYENKYLYIFKGNGGLRDRVVNAIKPKRGLDRYGYYKEMSREKTLDIFAQSRCILDLQHPWQVGLSMRPFHAIRLHSKLITTNKDIVNYDFYNKNNIWIMDLENPELPDQKFIYGEYEELPDEVYEFYSIKSWCKRLELLF